MSGVYTGRGGFGALMTGALPPEVETGMQGSLVAIGDLHDQIYNDMRTLADQGVDVTEYRNSADAIATEKHVLWSEIAQIDESQAPALRERIAALHQHASDVSAQLLTLRRGAPEQQQFMGFAWGIGALAAAGAVAWFVWDRRKKRRSR